jgi:Tfp pilus assembly protein PilX
METHFHGSWAPYGHGQLAPREKGSRFETCFKEEKESMKNRLILLTKDESGVALVVALILIIVLTLIGLASTFSSTYEIKLSGNKRGSTDAFYAADSGVQVTTANIKNFDLPGQYVDDKYNPFTDNNNPNPNPTLASVTIQHNGNQTGAPRGFGMSATQVNYEHYMIESSGEDQIELNPIRSRCIIEEKVVRMVPTLQGGS